MCAIMFFCLHTYLYNNTKNTAYTGEFASGSVPGAVNIPLDRVEQSLSRFKGHEAVVVFCRSGMRSSQALDILQRNGIKEVVNGGSWEKVRDAKASLATKK